MCTAGYFYIAATDSLYYSAVEYVFCSVLYPFDLLRSPINLRLHNLVAVFVSFFVFFFTYAHMLVQRAIV